MILSNGFEINVDDKFNFGVVAGGTANTRTIQRWQALKINEDSVFMGRVGKDGNLLKPNRQNMVTLSFSWLKIGHGLGNIAKVS